MSSRSQRRATGLLAGLSPEERVHSRRFEEVQRRSQTTVMLEIERCVCGCDYGGDSWTTRQEADDFVSALKLRPRTKLLDLGAGTGWPGLYMASSSGCDVTLVDLPQFGLQTALARAQKDGIAARVQAIAGDASNLDFPDGSFDAISHSDLLCCLKPKRAVLSSCRRVISSDGIMAFAVIFIAGGLSEQQYRHAVENGPPFIESDEEYEILLEQTGWQIEHRRDLTSAYRDSCCRQQIADRDRRDELIELLGRDEYLDRVNNWQRKIEILEQRHIRRYFFVARPNRAAGVRLSRQ